MNILLAPIVGFRAMISSVDFHPLPAFQSSRSSERIRPERTSPASAGRNFSTCCLAFCTAKATALRRFQGTARHCKSESRRERALREREESERRGRRGEDAIIAARERGLREVELLAGFVAGPLAAMAYPYLRDASAELINGNQPLCFDFIGLCGSVPEAMQVFFRNTVGLLFSFLLGYTASFLLARQEKFYEAMYEESAVLTQLLEEAPLLLAEPELLLLFRFARLYLASSTWRNASFIPSELVARTLRSDKDPVEEISRLLISIQTPGSERLLTVVTALRMARSRKYSSMQRIIPTSQFGLLVLLGVFITLTPFLDGKSDTSVLAQFLYGLLVEVLIFVIVYVGGGPGLGIYTTDQERKTILQALMQLIDKTESDIGRKRRASQPVPKSNESNESNESAAKTQFAL